MFLFTKIFTTDLSLIHNQFVDGAHAKDDQRSDKFRCSLRSKRILRVIECPDRCGFSLASPRTSHRPSRPKQPVWSYPRFPASERTRSKSQKILQSMAHGFRPGETARERETGGDCTGSDLPTHRVCLV